MESGESVLITALWSFEESVLTSTKCVTALWRVRLDFCKECSSLAELSTVHLVFRKTSWELVVLWSIHFDYRNTCNWFVEVVGFFFLTSAKRVAAWRVRFVRVTALQRFGASLSATAKRVACLWYFIKSVLTCAKHVESL